MLLFLAIFASEIGAIFVGLQQETGSHVTESFFLCPELNLLKWAHLQSSGFRGICLGIDTLLATHSLTRPQSINQAWCTDLPFISQ